MFDPETVPCEICGSASSPIDKRCDGCWEVEHRLASYIRNPAGHRDEAKAGRELRTARPRAGLLPVGSTGGCPEGRADEFWFAAEDQLRQMLRDATNVGKLLAQS